MSGTAIVTEIVQILVAGITQLGTGIGAGISNFAQALAFTGTGSDQTLSVYFVLVIVFAGVSLAKPFGSLNSDIEKKNAWYAGNPLEPRRKLSKGLFECEARWIGKSAGRNLVQIQPQRLAYMA